MPVTFAAVCLAFTAPFILAIEIFEESRIGRALEARRKERDLWRRNQHANRFIQTHWPEAQK